MTTTSPPRTRTAAPPEPPGPERWRLLWRRVLWVGVAALVAVAGLVTLFAWLALRIDWDVPDPAALSGPSEFLAADGTVLARFDSEVDRRPVELDAVSQAARDAVVAAEDHRFYDHEGVDPWSLLRAVVTNVRTGDVRQGGSTLTQQYVKNAFTGSERTLTRKVREAVISIALERTLPKEEILERYLNTVYFGEGAYGIEAAALTYFGVSAAELDVARSALLAQLLPAPSRRNPRVDPDGAVQRAERLIDRMASEGFIGGAEARDARPAEVTVQPPEAREFRAPYFTEYVRRQVEQAYGTQALLTGALTVRTSLDLGAQAALDEAVREQLYEQLEDADPHPVASGAAVVDPATGYILATHGGRDFATQQLDLGTQMSSRQPGSTFKPFAFLAALEQGIEPDASYRAPRALSRADGCGEFSEPVRNAGGTGYGRLDLDDALANSVNTVLVQVGCETGPEHVVALADRLGVRNDLLPEPLIAIGGVAKGPSPLDMASAFATLANDGVHCPARAIVSVTGPDGEELQTPDEVVLSLGQDGPRTRRHSDDELAALMPKGTDPPERDGHCYRVLDADLARVTTEVLERVVADTTGRRAAIDRPQAGKTGTTNNETDAWFAGYTPDLSMAIWVGRPSCGDPDDAACQLTDVAGFRRVQGGTIPALVWRDAAEAILAAVPPTDFLEPGELEGDGGVRVAPPRSRPTREPSPTPTATSPSEPTETPTRDGPTPSPEPTGSRNPLDPGDGGDGGDDDECILVLGDCD